MVINNETPRLTNQTQAIYIRKLFGDFQEMYPLPDEVSVTQDAGSSALKVVHTADQSRPYRRSRLCLLPKHS